MNKHLQYRNIGMQIRILHYTSRLTHLVILQKKQFRIITKSLYNSHTAPLYHMHGFLNIEQIKEFQISEFMFRLNLGLLPKAFSTYMYFMMVSYIHTHLTRLAKDYRVTFSRINIRSFSIKQLGLTSGTICPHI